MKNSTDYTICFPFVGDSIGGSVISTIIVVEELKNIEELSLRVILHQEGPLAEWLRIRGIDYQVKSDLPYYSGSEPEEGEDMTEEVIDWLKTTRQKVILATGVAGVSLGLLIMAFS